MTNAARRGIFVIVVIIAVIALASFARRTIAPGPFAFAGGGTVMLADYRAADPTGVPASLKDADVVKRGEYLARAGDCLVCHTAPGGAAYAGGLAIPLPFGTLYSTNITSDKATGIGNYSDADFLNALRRGIGPDGTRFYPAMPYPSYTYMTDADALAIKAYLFSLPAVHKPNQADTLKFPFNQRWTMVFWSLAFNEDRRFEPDIAQSAGWNRGAYVAEALAHCGECHTPRNPGFALDNRKKFAGAVTAGWHAFNITPDKGSGIGAWSDDELFAYLSAGHASGRGTASGPMGEAVDQSFSQMDPADIRAVVAYVRSVPAVASSELVCDHRAAGAGLAKGRRRDIGRCGQEGIRGCLRRLPQLDRHQRDHALCHHRRRARGERSDGHQCRPDRDFRNRAAHARGNSFDAGFRRDIFRCGNCRRCQLRHRALRQCAVQHYGKGRCRAAEPGVAIAANLLSRQPAAGGWATDPARRKSTTGTRRTTVLLVRPIALWYCEQRSAAKPPAKRGVCDG